MCQNLDEKNIVGAKEEKYNSIPLVISKVFHTNKRFISQTLINSTNYNIFEWYSLDKSQQELPLCLCQ